MADKPENLEALKPNVSRIIYNQPYNKHYNNAHHRTKNIKHFVEKILPGLELGEALRNSFDRDIYSKSIEGIVNGKN